VNNAAAQTAGAVGSTAYVYLAAIVAATSGLLFGFDIAVINGAIIFLRSELHLNDVQTEFAVSALLFGCIFGASFAGWLSDRLGRRRVLMMSAALFGLSALGAAIRDVVDRRHGFCEETGVAVRDAEDETPNAYALGFGRGRGQRRDGLEAVTVAALVRRLLEVIRDRKPIEPALVGEPPEPSQLVKRPAEVTDVDAEPDAARLIPVWVGGHVAGRGRHRGRRRGRIRGRAFGSAGPARARGSTCGGRKQQRGGRGEQG